MIGLDQVVSVIVDISIKIHEQIKMVKSNSEECSTLSGRIENIATIVKSLKSLNLDLNCQNNLIKPLDDLVDVMLDALKFIGKVNKKGGLAKFIKAGSINEQFEKIIQDLTQRSSDVQLAIGTNNARQLQLLVEQTKANLENYNVDQQEYNQKDVTPEMLKDLKTTWDELKKAMETNILNEIKSLGHMQVEHHGQNQQQFNNLAAQANRGYNQAEAYHDQTTTGLNKIQSQVGNLSNATIQNGYQLQGVAQQLDVNHKQLSAMEEKQRQQSDFSSNILTAVQGNQAELKNLLREKEETDQHINAVQILVKNNGSKLDDMAIEQKELGVDVASVRSAIDTNAAENKELHSKLTSDLQAYREVTMEDAQHNRKAQQQLIGMQQQVVNGNQMIIDQGTHHSTQLQELQAQQQSLQEYMDARMVSMKRHVVDLKNAIPVINNNSAVFFPPPSPSQEGEIFFREGQRYEQKNKLDVAQKYYKKAVKKGYLQAKGDLIRIRKSTIQKLMVENQTGKIPQEELKKQLGDTPIFRQMMVSRKDANLKVFNDIRKIYQKAPEDTLDVDDLFQMAMFNSLDVTISATTGFVIGVLTDDLVRLNTAKLCYEKIRTYAEDNNNHQGAENKAGHNVYQESRVKLDEIQTKLAAQPTSHHQPK